MASRLTHIGLCISEPERSLHFYEQLLGFRRVSELQQIVNIEEVKLKAAKTVEGSHRQLEIGFTASTFRFLDPNERGPSADEAKGRRRKK